MMTARLRLDRHEPPETMSFERDAGRSDGSTCTFLPFETVDVPKDRFAKILGKWLDFHNAAANFAPPFGRVLDAIGLFLRGRRGYCCENHDRSKEQSRRKSSQLRDRRSSTLVKEAGAYSSCGTLKVIDQRGGFAAKNAGRMVENRLPLSVSARSGRKN
jgi:hypothetical protein